MKVDGKLRCLWRAASESAPTLDPALLCLLMDCVADRLSDPTPNSIKSNSKPNFWFAPALALAANDGSVGHLRSASDRTRSYLFEIVIASGLSALEGNLQPVERPLIAVGETRGEPGVVGSSRRVVSA